MRITPNLHFNGNCEEALRLYKRAFMAKVTTLLRYSDADPEDMSTECLSDKDKRLVYHAEMVIGGQRFFCSDHFEEIPCGQNLSIVITFERIDDVKASYRVLADGATIVHPLQERTYSGCFVSLVDKFGMRWELMTERSSWGKGCWKGLGLR